MKRNTQEVVIDEEEKDNDGEEKDQGIEQEERAHKEREQENPKKKQRYRRCISANKLRTDEMSNSTPSMQTVQQNLG